MDTDGFPLATISEKSVIDHDVTPVKPKKRGKRAPLRPADSNGEMENGVLSMSTSIPSSNHVPAQPLNQTKTLESSVHSDPSDEPTSPTIHDARRYEEIEVTSIPDEDDNYHRDEQRVVSERPSQLITDHDTMVSSYTTGGENDVIEIHQFSTADIDAYLDIYFETLDNRLRHYIGEDEQLQQFRVAMKNRINADTNAREYQNVLLGKMNGEVLAAVTMSFPAETPTVPPTLELPQQNSCLRSIRRWMIRQANYIPTNMEECYIEMIGVKSAYRSHGIGAAMLECVEHFARQAGANLLTIHTSGQQLQTYFERYGFGIDRSDNSSFWKWVVERQNTNKLSKTISAGENVDYTEGSYINESMVGSVNE